MGANGDLALELGSGPERKAIAIGVALKTWDWISSLELACKTGSNA